MGWETCKRERMFSEKRKGWKIRNVKFLNLKEGGKQLPPENVWMFWKTKTSERIPNETEASSGRIAKQREQMLQNLEDDKKKAKTVNKKKRLQEECARMMTRLVVDWESEKHQEEEAAFKRIEEAEKKFCAEEEKC